MKCIEPAAFEFIQFVSRLRELLMIGSTIQVLYEVGEKEWDIAFNSNTEEHLIQGVGVSPSKSDAVRIYIAKVSKVHLNTVGPQMAAWSHDSLSVDHEFAQALVSRMNSMHFNDHRSLFMAVVGRLLGYDQALLSLGLEKNTLYKVDKLVTYHSSRMGLSIPDHVSTSIYGGAVAVLQRILLSEEGFAQELYSRLYSEGILFYADPNNDKLINHWDLFELILTSEPTQNLILTIDADDHDPVLTIKTAQEAYGETNVHVAVPANEYLRQVEKVVVSGGEEVSLNPIPNVMLEDGSGGVELIFINLKDLDPNVLKIVSISIPFEEENGNQSKDSLKIDLSGYGNTGFVKTMNGYGMIFSGVLHPGTGDLGDIKVKVMATYDPDAGIVKLRGSVQYFLKTGELTNIPVKDAVLSVVAKE